MEIVQAGRSFVYEGDLQIDDTHMQYPCLASVLSLLLHFYSLPVFPSRALWLLPSSCFLHLLSSYVSTSVCFITWYCRNGVEVMLTHSCSCFLFNDLFVYTKKHTLLKGLPPISGSLSRGYMKAMHPSFHAASEKFKW